MKNPQIIAVDIDEVLADFLSYFVYFHNLMYKTQASKEDMKKYYLHEVFNVEREEMSIRYLEFKSLHLLERLKPVEGSKTGIKKLIELGFVPHLVTARPQVIEKETRKWLSIHFPRYNFPIHFAHNLKGEFKKKSEICKEIGAETLIDDHIDNALDCAENGIMVFLMDAPWNQAGSLPEDVVRVKSWMDIIKKIEKTNQPNNPITNAQ